MFMLLFFFLIALIIVATALLPQITGLAIYSKNPNFKKNRDVSDYVDEEKAAYRDHSSTGGYVPPDEQIDSDELTNGSKSKKSDIIGIGSGVYQKVSKLTKDDLPIKMNLVPDSDDSNVLKRRGCNKRKIVTNTDSNPNNYDYDLDSLIEEELENDALETKLSNVKNNDYIGV